MFRQLIHTDFDPLPGDKMINSTIKELTIPVDQKQLSPVWKYIRHRGYFVADDRLLQTTENFRQRFHRQYFNDDVLQRCPADIPPDRERARDVLRYEWTNQQTLILTGHHITAIADRTGHRAPREFPRVELTRNGEFIKWAASILSLVPPERRLRRGTFGVNLFRTHTQVVTSAHQEYEDFIVVYVLDRVGMGADTNLHDVHNVDKVVKRINLHPGQFILFDDSRFKHSASSLIDPPAGKARRDVLVCTVNFADTYAVD